MEQKHIISEQEWMVLIQECRARGLSDKEWCLQHSIPVSTFYNKISSLRKKACAIPASQKDGSHAPQEVVPVQIMEGSDACMGACTTARNTAVHVPFQQSADLFSTFGYILISDQYLSSQMRTGWL